MRKLLLIILSFVTFRICAQIGFQPYQAIPVGSWPEVVCIGDVNNDGLNDVVLGNAYYFDPPNDYKIFVFTQSLSGSLNSPVIYPYTNAYPGIESISIADVNNDNLNDVIIGFSDSIGIYFQNTSGTLNALQTYYSGTKVDGTKCGDLNNDGLIDITVAHWNENFIRVFYQNATGFWDTTYTKPNGGYDEIDVGDVNGDGLNDVVFMAGQGSGGIHVFTQNTSGFLNGYVSYFPSGTSWLTLHGIAIGDLNQDGRNDVAASMGGNSPNAHITVWLQDTTTGLLSATPNLIGAYDIPEPIEIADLNCDNKPEILTAHGGWMKTSVYEADSNGDYNAYEKYNIPYASHYNPYGLAVGDINGDQKQDIAIADYNSGLILLINNSLPTQFDTVSLFTTIDTFYTNTFTTQVYYSDTLIVFNNGYKITLIDSFKISTTYIEDSIITTTQLTMQGELCSAFYTDTTETYNTNAIVSLVTQDTMLFSTTIDSINTILNVNFYPNPTTGNITIELPAPYDTQELILILYNYIGQPVYSKFYNHAGNKLLLNLNEYSNGIYTACLIIGKKRITNKISKTE